jgi:hypothetical protein
MARIYPWLVLVFWGATMSWLVASKVLPPLLGGQPPDYSVRLPSQEQNPDPIGWRITWNDRRIGTAVSQPVRRADGGISLRQLVHFDRLPLNAMLAEGFGAGFLGSLLKPLAGGEQQLEFDLQLATELRFNAQREFISFQSVVDMAGVPGFLQLQGVATVNRSLAITSRFGPTPYGAKDGVLRHEISLPSRSLVSDPFAPRPELRNLRVGQQWTIPMYRPFPPNSPVRIVEAVAQRLDVIVWNGRDIETILVEYREDAGSGLHAARDPILREWVRTDGQVLKHEIRVSGLLVTFERLTQSTAGPEAELLDPEKHPRLWMSDEVGQGSLSAGGQHD